MQKYNKNDKFQSQYMLAPHPDRKRAWLNHQSGSFLVFSFTHMRVKNDVSDVRFQFL